jgi:hypothetical protein
MQCIDSWTLKVLGRRWYYGSTVGLRLELHKQSAVVRSPLDKERVAREIESMDTRIDRLVYELSHKGIIYGLSEDEIRIMEGKN